MRARHAFALFVLIAVAPPLGALPVRDARALPAAGDLRVRMEAGRLELRPGVEERIEVEGELPAGVVLRWREAPGGISLRVEDTHRLVPRDVRLLVRVPVDAGLRLDVGHAEVSATGVGGGGLALRGDSGTVDVAAAGGDVRIETRSGRVALVSGAPVRVHVGTIGGEIDASFGAAEDAVIMLETVTGPITVRLPPGAAAAIWPRLGRGALHLPAVASGKPDGSVVLGDGEGGGRVVVESVAGDVHIVEDGRVEAPTTSARN